MANEKEEAQREEARRKHAEAQAKVDRERELNVRKARKALAASQPSLIDHGPVRT